MEKIKKERRFLKTLGKVGEILIQEVLIKVGKSLVQKIGGKKHLPSIIFLSLFYNIAFASIDSIPYPITGNKQRLGWQTSGNGLVYRGRSNDTITKPTSYADKNVKAYLILDSVRGTIFVWRQTYWDSLLVGGGGGGSFTQPVDSLFFDTSVSPNNVDTAKMRWDSDLGTVVLGMYDQVPNELGFKNFWLVKNQTGSTITKGSIVYANGTVGASGRITVAKFIANGTIEAKYLLGVTAHDLTDGEDGYVISFGKIRQVNTDTFAAGAILYPSPTVAGVWTDIEPVAPNLDLPIGFCINSSSNNGTIAIRYASGYKLNELHDVSITSPVEKGSLYYSGGLWRDTTAALLTSDTASMLTNYLRTGVASSTYLPLTGGTVSGTINRQEGSHDGSTSTFYYNILNYFAKRDNNKGNQTAQITFTDRPGTATFENNVRTSDIYLMTAKNFNGSQLGQYLDTTFSVVANQDGGRIGISKLNPAYKLDVNGTLGVTGNSLIGGTLGVTGTTTIGNTNSGRINFGTDVNDISLFRDNNYDLVLQQNESSANPLYIAGAGDVRISIDANNNTSNYFIVGSSSVKSSNSLFTVDESGNGVFTGNLQVNKTTVLNEDSGDHDTRIESDGNANMVFVDASTDRVGIGTNTPSKTLDVNGEVKIATVTATPTALLGKDASNVVGEVTTVAQTGLMTRGATTATTGSPSAVFTVTHGLGSNPTAVIVTGAGAVGAQKLIFEVYAKNSTTFSVQVWNYDGTEAAGISVTIYWLAIK